MVSVPSRFILPALAGLLSLTLTAPALADAPAYPDQVSLESALPAPDALLPAPASPASETLAAEAVVAPVEALAVPLDALFAPALAPAPAPVLPAPAPAPVLPAPAPAAPIAPAVSAAPAAPGVPDLRAEELEAALLARVNVDRAAAGLAPLAADPELLGIARTRAAAQIGVPSLTHYDAAGKVAVQLLLNGGGFRYTLAGENLARLRADLSTGVAQATEEAEVALMNSPLHRKNILEPRFTKLAIGAVRGPDGKLIYAQIFRAA